MESEEFTSSYGVYTACRMRDLCLRYMGESPVLWADVTVTPCPCSKEFYEQVVAFGTILRHEQERGNPYPYSYRQMVAWLTEKEQRPKKKKERVIPLTQQRLSNAI